MFHNKAHSRTLTLTQLNLFEQPILLLVFVRASTWTCWYMYSIGSNANVQVDIFTNHLWTCSCSYLETASAYCRSSLHYISPFIAFFDSISRYLFKDGSVSRTLAKFGRSDFLLASLDPYGMIPSFSGYSMEGIKSEFNFEHEDDQIVMCSPHPTERALCSLSSSQ